MAVDARAVGAFEVGENQPAAVVLDLSVKTTHPLVIQLDGVVVLAADGHGSFQVGVNASPLQPFNQLDCQLRHRLTMPETDTQSNTGRSDSVWVPHPPSRQSETFGPDSLIFAAYHGAHHKVKNRQLRKSGVEFTATAVCEKSTRKTYCRDRTGLTAAMSAFTRKKQKACPSIQSGVATTAGSALFCRPVGMWPLQPGCGCGPSRPPGSTPRKTRPADDRRPPDSRGGICCAWPC